MISSAGLPLFPLLHILGCAYTNLDTSTQPKHDG